MSAPVINSKPASTVASTYCSFIADGAFDHVLMELSIQVDKRLAYAAVDDRHSAGVGAGDGCVRRR